MHNHCLFFRLNSYVFAFRDCSDKAATIDLGLVQPGAPPAMSCASLNIGSNVDFKRGIKQIKADH